MKELGDILAALHVLKEPAVLATVVAVEGSTYRRPGARMLVTPEVAGGRIGSISGGCLEEEVSRRAMYLTSHGPAVVAYETGLDDGASGASYTLGCGGRVTVLFERVGPGVQPEYLQLVDRHRRAGRAVAVAAVIAVEGEPGFAIGDRPVMGVEDEFNGSDGSLIEECRGALAAGASRHTRVETPSGRAHVLIEVIPAPVHLFLFGSGHDVEPVAALAGGLGWRITLVARRVSDAARRRFGASCEIVASDAAPDHLGRGLSTRGAAIVMNHNYAADTEAISQLLHSPVAYIGILGPRHRTDAMLSDVASARHFDGGVGVRMDHSRIHAPIGLDIGAEAPEEVALAIVAEVQAFFARRDGGPLRDRPGAIHLAVEVKVAAPVIAAACSVDVRP